MQDSPLTIAFEKLRDRIVRFEVSRPSGRVTNGSGFLVAMRGNSSPILATAAHVLPGIKDDDNEPAEIKIQRIDKFGSVIRQSTFRVVPGMPTKGIIARHDSDVKGDVAYLVLPAASDDGSPMLAADELPVPVVRDNYAPSPGTRVAWAGFPGLLERYAACCPTLCYFEGSVAAAINRPGIFALVVDGHALPGVSGGPMWFWSEESNHVEVAGIVSAYFSYEQPVEWHEGFVLPGRDGAKKDRMPGFCFVRPIFAMIRDLERELGAMPKSWPGNL